MTWIPKKLVEWIIRILPWLRDNIWPEVKEEIVELLKIVLKDMKDSINHWVDERSRKREEAARRKAEEAEREARNAQDESEADVQRAIAQVWREVAEQFRQDNEALKAKLAEDESNAVTQFSERLDSIQTTDIVSIREDGTITTKGSDRPLQLLEPNDDE